jgi:hypothetical protein
MDKVPLLDFKIGVWRPLITGRIFGPVFFEDADTLPIFLVLNK